MPIAWKLLPIHQHRAHPFIGKGRMYRCKDRTHSLYVSSTSFSLNLNRSPTPVHDVVSTTSAIQPTLRITV